VVTQLRVVEQHPRDDQGARERATSRLVGSRDVPRAEAAVEAK
jgi:hypothetical protein